MPSESTFAPVSLLANQNKGSIQQISPNTGWIADMQKNVFSSGNLVVALQSALEVLFAHLEDESVRGLTLLTPTELDQKLQAILRDTELSQQDWQLNSDTFQLNQPRLKRLLSLYVETGIQVNSKGYMGRQFSSVIPLTGVVDFVSSLVNQPSSFYEAAQLPCLVEQHMASELNQFIGWPEDEFAMVTTSGGSLANLTAILAARNIHYPDYWQTGSAGNGLKPAIMVSSDVHYSISRAAGILGIGAEQIIKLPLNEAYQIDCQQLTSSLQQAQQKGLDVFCLVASAGTTSVGAFDDFNRLADFTAEHNIWLHVDGAHGGSLLVSDLLRNKLSGLVKADSFSWDAHKTLFVPAMCTLLFYKNKAHSYQAFQQQASYVFEPEPDVYTELDSAEQNFECTKRPLIMNLWLAWTLYGQSLFASKLEYLCELTQAAYQWVRQQDDFIYMHQPECNIFCFRYQPSNLDVNPEFDLQLAIRNQLKADGKYFISKVTVAGETALRVCFMNHQIELSDFDDLLNEIRNTGQQLLAKPLSKAN